LLDLRAEFLAQLLTSTVGEVLDLPDGTSEPRGRLGKPLGTQDEQSRYKQHESMRPAQIFQHRQPPLAARLELWTRDRPPYYARHAVSGTVAEAPSLSLAESDPIVFRLEP
jgi:hypothetical protein